MEAEKGHPIVAPPPASEEHNDVAVRESEALAKFCAQLIKGLHEDLKNNRVSKHSIAHVVDENDQLVLVGFDTCISADDVRSTMVPALATRYKRIGFQEEAWYVPPDKTHAYCDAGCPDLATWPDAGTLFMLRCECRYGGIETMIKVVEKEDGTKTFASPPELSIYGTGRGMFFYGNGDCPPIHGMTTDVQYVRDKLVAAKPLSSES